MKTFVSLSGKAIILTTKVHEGMHKVILKGKSRLKIWRIDK
jgi:hypothetical protein